MVPTTFQVIVDILSQENDDCGSVLRANATSKESRHSTVTPFGTPLLSWAAKWDLFHFLNSYAGTTRARNARQELQTNYEKVGVAALRGLAVRQLPSVTMAFCCR